jgi:hypothetical protein
MLRTASLMTLAVAVTGCAGQSPSQPAAAPPQAAATAAAAPPAAAGSSTAGPFRPSPSDPNTWPDACGLLRTDQLTAVWSGAFRQVGTYGAFLTGGNTPHYISCDYTRTAGGDLVLVNVDIRTVRPIDDAHKQFMTESRVDNGVPEGGLGDEAFFGSGEVEVRQGMTVWSVSVSETGNARPHAEQLARIIVREFA